MRGLGISAAAGGLNNVGLGPAVRGTASWDRPNGCEKEHFVSGAKRDNHLSPAFVPSLFAYTSVREREKQNYVFQKFLKTQQRKRKIRENSRCLADPSTTDVADMEEHEVTTDHNTDHSYSRDTGPGIVEPCVNPSCPGYNICIGK
ncbi:unnamed protein product [Gadus morhua 'NCC']